MFDLIIKNSQILHKDFESFSSTSHVFCKNGKIQDIQPSTSSVHCDNSSRLREIDAQNFYLLPGLVDTHLHLKHLGMAECWPNLAAQTSLPSALQFINSQIERTKNQQTPFLFFEFNERSFSAEKRFPTLNELDNASPETPILVLRFDGHVGFANSAFIKLAKLNNNEHIIHEEALYRLQERFFENDRGLTKDYLLLGQKKCLQEGITEIHEVALDTLTYECLMELIEEEKWYLPIKAAIYEDKLWKTFQSSQAPSHKLLQLVGRKFFLDGSLGASTAALSKPYVGSDTTGSLFFNADQLSTKIQEAARYKLQPFLHAIGDQAISTAIEAIRKAKVSHLNPRIEHAILLDDSHIKECLDLNICIAIQSTQTHKDKLELSEKLPQGFTDLLGRFRSLENTGILYINGSDAPFGVFSPWQGIDKLTCSWQNQKDQTINRTQALKTYTVNPAKLYSRQQVDYLETGSQLNAILVDRNILTCKNVSNTKVLATIIEGKVVYRDHVLA